MDKIGDISEQVNISGSGFAMIMGVIIIYVLFKELKENNFKEKLERAIENIKEKLDK